MRHEEDVSKVQMERRIEQLERLVNRLYEALQAEPSLMVDYAAIKKEEEHP